MHLNLSMIYTNKAGSQSCQQRSHILLDVIIDNFYLNLSIV